MSFVMLCLRVIGVRYFNDGQPRRISGPIFTHANLPPEQGHFAQTCRFG